MCERRDNLLNMVFVTLILGSWVMEIRGQGSDRVDQNAVRPKGGVGRPEEEHDPGSNVSVEGEVHLVTTAPPPNFSDHRLHLRGFLLHEALLTHDFRGQQQFFDLSGSPTSPGPGRLSTRDPSTHFVPHEDTPTSSDIATPSVTASALARIISAGSQWTVVTVKTIATTSSLTSPAVQASTSPPSTHIPTPSKPMKEGPPDEVSTTTGLASPDLIASVGNNSVKLELRAEHKTDAASQTPGMIDEEATVTTGITTTKTLVVCDGNLTAPEGYIEMPPPSRAWGNSLMECSCFLTVYLGYGVEVQVLDVSLLEGDTMTLDDLGGREPSTLVNQSILTKGLLVRSWSNQIAIRFQSQRRPRPGSVQLRYQAYVLSCTYPQRPANGDVSVTSLHAGGEAYFYCSAGYQLQGVTSLTCRNATMPYWSGKVPQCLASCGEILRNATVGRIVSPGFPGNYSNNLTCHWVLEVPEGQRLHIHFEKVALAEDDDRLLIKDGNHIDSPPLYDSYEVEYLPNEGIVSSSQHLFVEFTTDGSGTSTGAAIRYEAFQQGHCYEPFVKYGNFTTSDPTFAVGAVVGFSCDPGYTLEQGSVFIECIDPDSPQWNETEPACRAVCSGEVTDTAGVVLSPNWPEAFDKGQDCIWGIHVEEDKRIMLDVQVLHVGKNDVLTFYDGDDLTANVLGQYSGSHPRSRLFTSTADVTVQFQSDPATDVFGYHRGFVVHFFEVPRNDTCPELPEIPSGWKSTSHPELVHGVVVTYQCYPGFQLKGTEVLMCQWDLTWSGDVPSCERMTLCTDPGTVEHSHRVITESRFAVGSTVQYICDKGYTLTGSSQLICYSRDSAGPKWSERPPKCVPETYEPCRNPGAPSFTLQRTEKRFYQAGETLHYGCLSGYELLGEPTIHCVPGHPSQWSSPPPTCRASSSDYLTDRRLDVSSADLSMERTNIAIAVLIPAFVTLVVIIGIYLYFSKFQWKSLRLPMSASPPYDNMAAESAFNNPIYDSAETREYEVSI